MLKSPLFTSLLTSRPCLTISCSSACNEATGMGGSGLTSEGEKKKGMERRERGAVDGTARTRWVVEVYRFCERLSLVVVDLSVTEESLRESAEAHMTCPTLITRS